MKQVLGKGRRVYQDYRVVLSTMPVWGIEAAWATVGFFLMLYCRQEYLSFNGQGLEV